MSLALVFALLCGLAAVAYGIYTTKQVTAASAGNERMQEIAAAIQEGASAYLNRQYMAIGVAGVVVGGILLALLGLPVAIGFVIGAVLSGAAGFIGMKVATKANVRTATLPVIMVTGMDTTPDRIRVVAQAMREGLTNAEIQRATAFDPWFLDRIATHILAYEDDSQVTFFEGNYTEYEADRKKRLGDAAAQPHRVRYKKLA